MRLRVRAPRVIERPFLAASSKSIPSVSLAIPKVRSTPMSSGESKPRSRFGEKAPRMLGRL